MEMREVLFPKYNKNKHIGEQMTYVINGDGKYDIIRGR